MVLIKNIQEANRSRSSKPKTAVFVGATSGIGLGGIEALLKSTKGSTVFIIGRSKSKFATSLSRLRSIDPKATITFLEAQVSLLQDIDRVCRTVSDITESLDILWLSQGGLGLRENLGCTGEGLPSDFAVSYYGRILFMRQLAPLLGRSADGRVLSILSAGFEGPVSVSDPCLMIDDNYAATGFWGAQKQGVTMQSMAMLRLASQHPKVTFIHTNPGPVSTEVHAKWSNSFTGVWTPVAWLIKFVMMPLFSLVGYTSEQAGEIGLFEVLDESFSRSAGTNFYRLDDKAEDVGKAGLALLDRYREDLTEEQVWEHTAGVFDRILGR